MIGPPPLVCPRAQVLSRWLSPYLCWARHQMSLRLDVAWCLMWKPIRNIRRGPALWDAPLSRAARPAHMGRRSQVGLQPGGTSPRGLFVSWA